MVTNTKIPSLTKFLQLSMVDGAAGDNGLNAVPLVQKGQLPGRGLARIQSLHMEADLARAMIPKVKHAT